MSDSCTTPIVLRAWQMLSSVNNSRKFPMVFSLGRKMYGDMLSRNKLYSKELRNKSSSNDGHWKLEQRV